MTKAMTDYQKVVKFFRKIDQTYLKGVKPDQFIRKLEQKEIDVVVDIRNWSRFPTYFAPKQMKNLLEIHNIEYERFQKLGNPKRLRDEAEDDPILAKKLYTEYLKKNDAAKEELRKLFYILRLLKRFCFICYCPTENPKECHRFWLIEVLVNKKRKNLALEPLFNIFDYYRAKIARSVDKELTKIKLKQQKMEEWIS